MRLLFQIANSVKFITIYTDLLGFLIAARRSPSEVRPDRVKRAGSEPYVPLPGFVSRAGSVPRSPSAFDRAPSLFERAASLAPFSRPLFRASSLEPLDELFARKLPAFGGFDRAASPSPTPVKPGRWAPRSSEVAFDADGNSNTNSNHTLN